MLPEPYEQKTATLKEMAWFIFGCEFVLLYAVLKLLF